MGAWFDSFKQDFYTCFIASDRWKMLVQGLGNTLKLTLLACIFGVLIGVVVSIVRVTYDKQHADMRRGLPRFLLGFFDKVCRIYLTVIRGTPVVVQLLIFSLIIFSTSRNTLMIATVAFSINSGAYVAEIIRGGIMSIDHGQFEAGRSLGFNYVQTMCYIILPQALKNVLPSLANEFIVLLKETSVAGYVAMRDLTKAGETIIGATYSVLLPLLAVAAIYLILVVFFSWLVGKLERRLRNSEH